MVKKTGLGFVVQKKPIDSLATGEIYSCQGKIIRVLF